MIAIEAENDCNQGSYLYKHLQSGGFDYLHSKLCHRVYCANYRDHGALYGADHLQLDFCKTSKWHDNTKSMCVEGAVHNQSMKHKTMIVGTPLRAALAAIKALCCSSKDSSSRLPFFFFSGEKAGSAWSARASAASMACNTAFSPSVHLQDMYQA